MTLGEYACKIASVILEHGQESSIASKLITRTDGKLIERNIPAAERKWFWHEVANQITARRPVLVSPDGGDGLFSRARDQVLDYVGRLEP